MESKICSKCKIEKSTNDFHKDKTHKDGYRSICKLCVKEYQKSRYVKVIKNNSPKISIKEYNKEYYLKHKDKIKSRTKKYYKDNKEKIKLTKIKYRPKKRILDKIYRENNKEQRNLKERERRINDLLYRLTTNIRKLILKSFKDKKYSKQSKTYEILGCTYKEFKNHIESQWESWMNWDNYSLYNGEKDYGWEMDHIIPLSSAKTEKDVIRLNHYSNFQPLCCFTNRYIKKDNLIY